MEAIMNVLAQVGLNLSLNCRFDLIQLIILFYMTSSWRRMIVFRPTIFSLWLVDTLSTTFNNIYRIIQERSTVWIKDIIVSLQPFRKLFFRC